MVLYFFPPGGGVSTARNVRNVRHLPRYGWQPAVLAPRNGAYELFDPQSMAAVPNATEVLRTRSIEAGHVRRLAAALRAALARRLLGSGAGSAAPGPAPSGDTASFGTPRRGMLARLRPLLFFPDDQVGWIPFAIAGALRAHLRRRLDAVYSTASPVSAHLVAGVFKLMTGVPWIVEFRDPWRGNSLATSLPRPYRLLQARLERWIVQTADVVICVTPSLTSLYQRRYPAATVVTVTNGYDATAAAGRPRPRERSRFRIVYAGSLDRVPDLRTFLEGVDRLVARCPEVTDRLEILFYGQVSAGCQRAAAEIMKRGRLASIVRFAGFVPRAVALDAVSQADACLVLLPSGPGTDLFVPAKLYEYLGRSRQVLAIVPPGDARAVLQRLGWGVVADPDPDEVGRAVEELLALPPPDRPADPEHLFDGEALAGQLAACLSAAAARKPPWGSRG